MRQQKNEDAMIVLCAEALMIRIISQELGALNVRRILPHDWRGADKAIQHDKCRCHHSSILCFVFGSLQDSIFPEQFPVRIQKRDAGEVLETL